MNMVDASEYGFCLTMLSKAEIENNIIEGYNKYNLSEIDGDVASIIINFSDVKIYSIGSYASQLFLTFCYENFNMTYEQGLEYVKLFSFESSQLLDNRDSAFFMNGSGWNEDYKFMFDIGHNEDLLMYIKLKYPNIRGHMVQSRYA